MSINFNHLKRSIDVSWNNSSLWSIFTKLITETSESKFQFIEPSHTFFPCGFKKLELSEIYPCYTLL